MMTTALVDPFRADAFAADALYAYWDGSGDETAARELAAGPEAIGPVLTQWAGAEVLVSVSDDRDWFVEGRLGDTTTFVAALQVTRAGTIARCLSFHCPLVEPAPVPRSPSAHSARAVLDRYFTNLTAGEFDAACACFSDDCLYSHPPYSAGAQRAEFHGRAELLAGFQTVRGTRPSRLPRIVCGVQDGSHAFIEGVVDGDPPRGSFVSSLSLDDAGLIRRYVAFYTDSRVQRL